MLEEEEDVIEIYPSDKLHDDRVHGTFNVVVMIGCEGPVVRVVFDLRFRLGRHAQVPNLYCS